MMHYQQILKLKERNPSKSLACRNYFLGDLLYTGFPVKTSQLSDPTQHVDIRVSYCKHIRRYGFVGTLDTVVLENNKSTFSLIKNKNLFTPNQKSLEATTHLAVLTIRRYYKRELARFITPFGIEDNSLG